MGQARHRTRILAALFALLAPAALAQHLPDTQPLTLDGDLAAQMVDGIHAYLDRATEASIEKRAEHWERDFSAVPLYSASVEANRERLRTVIGVVDERLPVEMEIVTSIEETKELATGSNYTIYPVRWPVLDGVHGEGLLLEPDDEPVASVVTLPDCDWQPEDIAGLTEAAHPQYARQLVENGCRVIIPTLINRDDEYSGVPKFAMTNQPHREYVYRLAFQMGRHIIGYEVQKVLAAVDWLIQQQPDKPVGVFGYGEGGLIAMYSAAGDTRIDPVVVSGYFQPREGLHVEPIYRNVWSLLYEFGDAEIATLIAPRLLIIEPADHPQVDGPPNPDGRRDAAAPGKITTPSLSEVEREIDRAKSLLNDQPLFSPIFLSESNDGQPASDQTMLAFLRAIGVEGELNLDSKSDLAIHRSVNADARMVRQFHELVDHTQKLVRQSDETRADFWSKADDSSIESWQESTQWYRDYFYDEVIGRLPEPTIPLNPRTRVAYEQPTYTAYEVMLDVYPDVFAYGLLLLPNDIAPDEQRPVVVCQHGLEGRPTDLADPTVDHRAYHQYGCKLAERGFIVFAPQNPYIGGTNFRQLQRKANPLKLSLYSFITRQHERIIEWLSSLPYVDSDRIAFYGLSYGGKTAARVPALLDGYCLSICSGDFNEWIWKTASLKAPFVYQFTHEYEMYEFDAGNTFNYGELTGLICPRPFMVERGHNDGVSIDEWVAYEFAHTRRLYDKLGIGGRAEIEFFNGNHEINAEGAFQFLHKHLDFKL